MKILVCAATLAELNACKIKKNDFTFLRTGIGMDKAAKALAKYLNSVPAHQRPSLIVSSGFAGAVTSGLDVGDWISCERVWKSQNGTAKSYPCIYFDRVKNTDLISSNGVFIGSDVSLNSNGVERRQEALVVDMESAALAEVAQLHHIPFMVLRMVSDTPEKPLPDFIQKFIAANRGRGVLNKVIDYTGALVSASLHLGEIKNLVINQTRNLSAMRKKWKHVVDALGQ